MMPHEEENGMRESRSPFFVPARSKREAMDWGLVLISQEIHSTIVHDEQGWVLLIDEADFDRATSILKQWQTENRGWQWRHTLPGSDLLFHWGSLFWVLAIVAFYYKTIPEGIKNAGLMDSQQVMKGEWWRLFTAVTLHADPSHLLSNATMGWLFFGLAMARYGSGVVLLTGLLAGVIGNVTGFAFYTESHRSLGASGMVMGALGLLAVHPISFYRPVKKIILRGLAAGVLIFVLLAFAPEADVLAHLGGFVAGILFGFGLNRVPPRFLHHIAVNIFCIALLTALVFLTWWLALR